MSVHHENHSRIQEWTSYACYWSVMYSTRAKYTIYRCVDAKKSRSLANSDNLEMPIKEDSSNQQDPSETYAFSIQCMAGMACNITSLGWITGIAHAAGARFTMLPHGPRDECNCSYLKSIAYNSGLSEWQSQQRTKLKFSAQLSKLI